MLLMKTEVVYGPGMPLNIYYEDILHDPSINIKFISYGINQQ
jgi:hypothetical protein